MLINRLYAILALITVNSITSRNTVLIFYLIILPYLWLAAQPYVSTNTPPSCYEIEARVRNGMTAYEGVLITPSTPPISQPNNIKWQLNPSGLPVWNSNGNHYGDIHTFLFTYTQATGTAVWRIDFNRDGDYTDPKETITNTSPTLVDKGFQYISILGQGYEHQKTVAVKDFTINDVNFGDYISTSNTPFSILYEDSTGLFKDIKISGSFLFSGSATPERPRLWVRLGESNFAPTCVLTKPLDGTLYGLGGSVHLEATAIDIPGKIVRVEFYDGNNKIGEDFKPPYTFDWMNVPAGYRTLRAKAIDNHTAMTWSNSVTILMNAPPAVTIIEPLQDRIYYYPDTLLVKAQIDDPNDTLHKVEFFLDGGFLGLDTILPFTFPLIHQPMGSYQVRVKSIDPFGATSFSLPVNFIIQCFREDLNNDGVVNVPDFLLILSVLGTSCNTTCRPDFNDDTAVNTYDFLRLLAVLNHSCN